MNLDTVPDQPVDFVSLPRSSARCADGNGTLSHLFFSSDDFDIARARSVCRKCDLAVDCLQGALDRNEAYGVWGGVLLVNGKPALSAPRRGRPSKRPISEFVVDEVPIPAHLVA